MKRIDRIVENSCKPSLHRRSPEERSRAVSKDVQKLAHILQHLDGAAFDAAVKRIVAGYSSTRSLLCDERGYMNLAARQALCDAIASDTSRPAQYVAPRLSRAQEIMTTEMDQVLQNPKQPSGLAIKIHEGLHALVLRLHDRRSPRVDASQPRTPAP